MRYIISSLIFLVHILSCSDKYNKETKIFNNYIEKYFPNQKFRDSSVIVIIPSQNCYSCLKACQVLINNYGNLDNFYLVKSEQIAIDIEAERLLIDELNILDHLNFGVNGALIIIYLKKKIYKLYGVNYENYQSIVSNNKLLFKSANN